MMTRYALLALVLFPACHDLAPPGPTFPVLRFVSGTNQTDTVGQTLPRPVVVRLVDSLSGKPIGDRRINWATLDGGSVSSIQTRTDASGTIRQTWTLGGR